MAALTEANCLIDTESGAPITPVPPPEAQGGADPVASRPLKNYLRWQYCVKNGLGMLIYSQ
jgi:hypothetical protein